MDTKNHCSQTLNQHRAGAAAWPMWRFIHELELGDLLVVSYGPHFYVAKVTGEALYLQENHGDDTSYRRPIEWLSDKKPIALRCSRAALISRMKTYGTSTAASDLKALVVDFCE